MKKSKNQLILEALELLGVQNGPENVQVLEYLIDDVESGIRSEIKTELFEIANNVQNQKTYET